MLRLSEQILAHAERLPEGAPVSAKSLLHLGNRAAVDQALSRLAERGQLIRAGRGVYLRPVASRFGTRAPSVEQAVEALASQRGEVIVSNGAAAANALGLTTQVPVRSVYLTSGRSRKMNLGKQVVELRHAPRWQLTLANRPAGEAVRALAWLGPEKAEEALKTLKRKMPPGVIRRVGRRRAAASDLARPERGKGRLWLMPFLRFRPRTAAMPLRSPPIDPGGRRISWKRMCGSSGRLRPLRIAARRALGVQGRHLAVEGLQGHPEIFRGRRPHLRHPRDRAGPRGRGRRSHCRRRAARRSGGRATSAIVCRNGLPRPHNLSSRVRWPHEGLAAALQRRRREAIHRLRGDNDRLGLCRAES